MAMDLNKLREKGLEYVEMGKNAAIDLTEKGKTQAKILNNQAKLMRAQRQLGALVYSLAKGNEENQPLVDKYIDIIGSIEQEIAQLKASLTPAEAAEVESIDPEEGSPEDVMEQQEPQAEPSGKCCPQCGAPVDGDALFCNRCGAQL